MVGIFSDSGAWSGWGDARGLREWGAASAWGVTLTWEIWVCAWTAQGRHGGLWNVADCGDVDAVRRMLADRADVDDRNIAVSWIRVLIRLAE